MSTFIKPVDTKTITNGTINTPSVMQGFGSEMSLGETVTKLATNIQRIRDLEDKSLGESYIASLQKITTEFENRLNYDKEAWQSDIELNSLKKQLEEKTAKYQGLVDSTGYDKNIMNYYLEKGQERFAETNTKFLTKYTKYREEQLIQTTLQTFDVKANNITADIMNGNFNRGLNASYELANEIYAAAEAGLIDKSKIPDMIDVQRGRNIESFVMYNANRAGGQARLQAMAKWNFSQFQNQFSGLQYEIGENQHPLTEKDYNKFMSAVHRGFSISKGLEKKEKEKTLYQEMELKAKRLAEPKEQAIKEGGYLAGTLIRNYPEIHVNSVNNQQGKEVVKSIDDIVNYNYAFPLSKAEDLSDITKSGEVSLEEIMKLRDDRTNRNVGGYGERIENHFEDTTGAEENIPGGSRYKKAYWTNPEFKNQMNSIYSMENQKKLKAWGNDKIKLDFSFDKDIAALKAAGEMGDFEAKRTAEALERIATDKVLIDIYDKNEGKIDQSYFTGKLNGYKKGKFQENEYIPIEQLTTDKKQLLAAKSIEDSIFPSWVKTSGRDNVKNTLENSKKALLSNETKIDLGDRGTIFLKENVDPVVTANKINEGIKNMTFYTANPNGLIETTRGNKKKIKVEKVPQSNKVFFLYNGEAQRDKDGKIIFLEVKE